MTQPVIRHFVRGLFLFMELFRKAFNSQLDEIVATALSGRAMLAIPDPNRRLGTDRQGSAIRSVSDVSSTWSPTKKSGRAI